MQHNGSSRERLTARGQRPSPARARTPRGWTGPSLLGLGVRVVGGLVGPCLPISAARFIFAAQWYPDRREFGTHFVRKQYIFITMPAIFMSSLRSLNLAGSVRPMSKYLILGKAAHMNSLRDLSIEWFTKTVSLGSGSPSSL